MGYINRLEVVVNGLHQQTGGSGEWVTINRLKVVVNGLHQQTGGSGEWVTSTDWR